MTAATPPSSGTAPLSVEQHEARVAQRYRETLSDHLKLRAKPYRNIGYWKDSPADEDEASLALLHEVLEWANVGPDTSVLDAGCGPGQSTLDMHLKRGCKQVVGIDLTQEHVTFATSLAKSAGLEDTVRFYQMSATRLLFPAELFDRVLAVDCACVFATRSQFFNEAFRVLKPGGSLVLADAVIHHPPQKGWKGLLGRLIVKKWSVPPENLGNMEAYVTSLRQAGFSKVEYHDVGRYVYGPVAAYFTSYAHRTKFKRIRGLKDYYLMRAIFRLMAKAHMLGYLDYCILKALKE